MKKICVVFCVAFMALPSFGQGVPDGEYSVDIVPWNFTYLARTKDQLVHGEEYRGYPGPFPKMYYAFGLDPQHEAVDSELLLGVKRDAPSWHGVCNGWAVASTTYPEPRSLVINGIKFFPGDLKAILSAIFKDNNPTLLGLVDRVNGGITARSFHDIINDRVAAGKNVIFDVENTDEVWNYPVAGFRKSSDIEGEFTVVTTTVVYAELIFFNDTVDNFFPYEETYVYRFKTDSLTDFEWVGDSKEAHPRLAWVNRDNYNVGVPVVTGNHYIDQAMIEHFLTLGGVDGNKDDLQEPNNSMAEAYSFGSELLLGSLLTDDTDFYRVTLAKNELFQAEFEVYDGRDLTIKLLNADGSTALEGNQVSDYRFNFRSPRDGDFYLAVSYEGDAERVESYYKFNLDDEKGSFSLPVGSDQVGMDVSLRALNTRDAVNEVSGVAVNTLLEYGSVDLTSQDGDHFRSHQRTVWVESREDGTVQRKTYYRDHLGKSEYTVPHMTCKNGWKTRLDIQRNLTDAGVTLFLYDRLGLQIAEREIPFEGSHRWEGEFRSLFESAILNNGAWMRFETASENALRGHVSFVHGSGAKIPFDIRANPRYGTMVAFDLLTAEQGGTGIALVNMSNEVNQIFYRVEEKSGRVKNSGNFMLQPGEKWLTTVAGLGDEPILADDTLFVFSHFQVEGLLVRYQTEPFVQLYGHRLLSDSLDQYAQTVISLPSDRSQASYIFMNHDPSPQHLLFQGYSADGTLQGIFNVEIGKPLRYREIRKVPLTQILNNGVNIKDIDAITHFRVLGQEPFYAIEFQGALDTLEPAAISLINLFEDP